MGTVNKLNWIWYANLKSVDSVAYNNLKSWNGLEFYSTSFPTSWLVAYYKLDDWSSTTAVDYVWVTNLTLSNEAIRTASWKISNAVDFAWTTYYMTRNGAILNTTTFSISCWIKSNSVGNFQQNILCQHTYSNRGIRMYIESSEYDNQIWCWQWTSSATDVKSTTSVSADTWYHIVFTRNGTTTNGQKIYINGAYEAQITNSMWSRGDNIYIWYDYAGYSHSLWVLNGIVDEVWIRNRVLTTDEISALYNSWSWIQP
jgi:hypothetical protein